VVPHANVDPDGIGSALALGLVLDRMGKSVTVLCPDDPLPEFLSFLPRYSHLETSLKNAQNITMTADLPTGVEIETLQHSVENGKLTVTIVPKGGALPLNVFQTGYGVSPYDLIVVIDTANLKLLGSLYSDNIDFFSSIPILNIDHHISNTQFGQHQLIDPTAASATEVLYEMITTDPKWNTLLDADLATLLLTGLITDTRSFQNPNTTPHSLDIAAHLLEKGAKQQEIINHIYKTKPLSTLKLWGRALHNIQIDKQAGIVWTGVSQADFQQCEAEPKETAGLLDELISNVPEAKLHIQFSELPEGGLKASLRSAPEVNISTIVQKLYQGGGHPRAAGFKILESDANFQMLVLQCVAELKAELQNATAAVEPQPQPPMPSTTGSTVVKTTTGKAVDPVKMLTEE
jgi:phosphoesterase RecJ-like protein